MSEAKHTPGPWQRHESHIYTADPERAILAQVFNPGKRPGDYPLTENANLIAAAPEMLDALETCCMAMQGERKAYCDCFQQGDMHSLDMDGNCAFSKTGKCRIWKAIQKARGQG
jgi:hypothetical protein